MTSLMHKETVTHHKDRCYRPPCPSRTGPCSSRPVPGTLTFRRRRDRPTVGRAPWQPHQLSCRRADWLALRRGNRLRRGRKQSGVVLERLDPSKIGF